MTLKTLDLLSLCAGIARLPGLRYLNVVQCKWLALTLHGPKEVAEHAEDLQAMRGPVFLFFVLLVPEGKSFASFSDEVKRSLPEVPRAWAVSLSAFPEGSPPRFAEFAGSFDI
ncbi:MAG: hypothetical protein AB7K24_34150 [Gemmataceae bacterium]